jgi:1,4-alpha-glucan branching enzyme
LSRLVGLRGPSSREGFPNVALEAMTLGTPVIAAPAGELPWMLMHEETGLLLDETTPEALANAIRRLRGMSSGERAGLARRARATVEQRYGIERVADAHLALYRRLARGLARRRSRP